MKSRAVAALSLCAWVASAIGVLFVLRASVIAPDGQPLTAAIEVIRRMALAGAWYVLGVTALATLTRAVRATALVDLVDALTVLPLRSAVRGALGVGLASALALSGPALATAGVDDPPIVTLHRLPPSAPSTTTSTTIPPAVVRPPPTAPTTPPTWAPSPRPPTTVTTPPRRPQPAPTVPAGAPTWRVARGQCFWTIAESVISAHLGRPVSDREIVPYWRALIAANRTRLRDPANPDLVFPGQVFVLPG